MPRRVIIALHALFVSSDALDDITQRLICFKRFVMGKDR
jgi:hypothetical protein